MRRSSSSHLWGDVANAALAIALAGIAYWQGEVAMKTIKHDIGQTREEVASLKRDLNEVRQDSQTLARSTRRIDNATRELLHDQRKSRDVPAFHLPW